MPDAELSALLISKVGSALGIEDLAFDAEGHCVLAVDEMPVAIQAHDHHWQLMGFVAEVPEGEENEELSYSADQWRSLLEINHALIKAGAFASLTYDKESECVLFIQPLQESQLDAAQIVTALEAFVFRLEEIRRLVSEVHLEGTPEDHEERIDDGMALLNQLV